MMPDPDGFLSRLLDWLPLLIFIAAALIVLLLLGVW